MRFGTRSNLSLLCALVLLLVALGHDHFREVKWKVARPPDLQTRSTGLHSHCPVPVPVPMALSSLSHCWPLFTLYFIICQSWNSDIISNLKEDQHISFEQRSFRNAPASASNYPTIISTDSPSMYPSTFPSTAHFPTILSTDVPSMYPSMFPSMFPSASPSMAPSVSMSDTPTVIPSQYPTAVPSVYPTQDLIGKCKVELENIINEVDITQSTLWYNNISNILVVPDSYRAWEGYISRLQNIQLSTYPTELIYIIPDPSCVNNQVVRYASVQLNNIVRRCSDPFFITPIWSSMINRRVFSVNCDGNSWQGSYGDKGEYIISVNTVSQYILGISIRNYTISWPEWTQSSSPGETNITVYYSLAYPGQIYCAAFLANQAVISTPLSVLQAPNRASAKIFDGQNLKGTLLITGLQTSTAYSVYCFTEGYLGGVYSISRSPMAFSIAEVDIVQTLIPPQYVMNVQVSFSSLTVGKVSSAITVEPAFVPRNLTVIPELILISSSPCSDTEQELATNNDYTAVGLDHNAHSSRPLHSKSAHQTTFDMMEKEQPIVAPSILSFQTLSERKTFYVQAMKSGCYGLNFHYDTSGINASSVETIISDDDGTSFDNIYIFNATIDTSLQSTMQSAQFSQDGLQIEVTFSAPTDIGAAIGLPMRFSIDKVLEFIPSTSTPSQLPTPQLFANEQPTLTAVCWFESATLLIISLPTLGLLPSPGDSLRLLPMKLKPACDSSISYCDRVDFIATRSVFINADKGPFPHASLAAPSQITLGSDLTLDITASTGNGGRAWNEIRWMVVTNDTAGQLSAITLQNYLNSGNSMWINCVPLTYSCDTVRNFAGRTSTSFRSVQVLDKPFVPSLHIVGSSLGTIFNNVSLVMRPLISIDEQFCSGVDVSWLVYENGVVRDNIATERSVYKDSRTLVIDPYILVPCYEYHFIVTVLCGQYASSAEATRYVAPCEVIPVLQNGQVMTVSPFNPVVIDASHSFLTCSLTHDLQFQWSCLQNSPLNDTGCDMFYKAIKDVNLSSNALVFSESQKIFTPGCSYLIRVRVSSPSQGISSEASQTVVILKEYSLSVPSLTVDVPVITLDGAYRYKIDGFVKGSGDILAEWTSVSNNITLSTRVLYQVSDNYFPAVITPSMLFGRSSFVFTLRAMAITAECSKFSCVPAAGIAAATIRVTVNQPPSAGYLLASPDRGNESTTFKISAINWQDEHLPLFYTFFQSNNNSACKYYLIRHRMQIPYMEGMIASADEHNNTVMLRAYIVDVLRARAESFSSVIVEKTTKNVTALIKATSAAGSIVLSQRKPEVIFPNLNFLVASATNCTNPGYYSSNCANIVETGTGALKVAMDKYNAGITLLTGLSSYLKALSNVDPIDAIIAAKDLLDIYNFLILMIPDVGFATGDGTDLVMSMLDSCDALLRLMDPRILDVLISSRRMKTLDKSDDEVDRDSDLNLPPITGNNSQLVAAQLVYSIHQLYSNYFSYFPFGYSQNLQSVSVFNITMRKGYWEEFNDDAALYTRLSDGVAVFGQIFPPNATSVYSSLIVESAVEFVDANTTTNVLRTKYVQLGVSGRTAEPLDIVVDFDLDDIAKNMLEYNMVNNKSWPVVHYRYCNDSSVEPVVCSPEDTNGPSYTFSVYNCLEANASQRVAYQCPLYVNQLVCISDQSEEFWTVEMFNSNLSTVSCRYPLSMQKNSFRSSSVSDYSTLTTASAYSYGTMQNTLSPASVTLLPRKPTSQPVSSPSSVFNNENMGYLAIIGISVAGVAFAIFLYYRVKASKRLGSNFDRVLPRTNAQYVQAVATYDIENIAVVPDGDGLDLVDAGDVQMIEAQAIAHPVIESRSEGVLPMPYDELTASNVAHF
jgi:hypothetical protein